MQFLPATRGRYAADGDADGVADPQNLYDSTLAAARYLCSGSTNLRDPAGVMTAILRYNNSAAYAQNVFGMGRCLRQRRCTGRTSTRGRPRPTVRRHTP
jgi:membrane-bound lytic murein transglycosylase B